MDGSDNMEEIWKDVVGYEGYYQVSNLGNVRGVDRYVIETNTNKRKLIKGKMLTKHKKDNGYRQVNLTKDGKTTFHYVHRIVMKAFKPLNDYTDMEVNHIDYNRSNNELSNLEWTNHKDNVVHSSSNGKYGKVKGSANHKTTFTEEQVIEMREKYYKQGIGIPQLVYEIYGIKYSDDRKGYKIKYNTIFGIINYRTWKHIP